jgi:hypothetical protein
VICVMQAFTHLSGQTPSVEHAVIGRRACEVEWDLLQMLDPGDPRSVEPRAPARQETSLHDRPSAVELLDATRGALGAEVLPLLAGRAAFELRVALRAIGIVRRELEQASAHGPLREQLLACLGVADEAQLAAAVRRGSFAGREAELCRALRALVRAKLEAANPRYLRETANAPAKESP